MQAHVSTGPSALLSTSGLDSSQHNGHHRAPSRPGASCGIKTSQTAATRTLMDRSRPSPTVRPAYNRLELPAVLMPVIWPRLGPGAHWTRRPVAGRYVARAARLPARPAAASSVQTPARGQPGGTASCSCASATQTSATSWRPRAAPLRNHREARRTRGRMPSPRLTQRLDRPTVGCQCDLPEHVNQNCRLSRAAEVGNL
jgi:hypothetical protein